MPIDPSKLTRRGLIALAASSRIAFAASDFWNRKSGGDWTAEEIQTLRTKSPWAKKVMGESAGGGARGGGGFGGEEGAGGEDAGMGGGGGGRRGGGGGGRGGGGGAQGGGGGRGGTPAQVIVRWDSARPLRDKNALPEALKECYAISVTGLPPAMIMSVGRGAQMPQDPADREKALIQKLLHSATLSAKGKDPEPASLLFQTSDRQSLIFGFKRDALALEPANKSAEFSLKLAGNTFKAKFDFKEMTYEGELAL